MRTCAIMLMAFLILTTVTAFQKPLTFLHQRENPLNKKALRPLNLEIELNTYTYGIIFVATLIPSLALVNFVGNQADNSRDKISLSTKEKFRRSLLEQSSNIASPTAEEEAIKRQIAKAFREDKDVDVAILEEKLRERAKWRKELQAQMQAKVYSGGEEKKEEDDGW